MNFKELMKPFEYEHNFGYANINYVSDCLGIDGSVFSGKILADFTRSELNMRVIPFIDSRRKQNDGYPLIAFKKCYPRLNYDAVDPVLRDEISLADKRKVND